MRILLANYRYFVSGGAERYLFAAKDGMEAQGHETVPFSIRYTKNINSKFAPYFVSPIAGPDAVRFGEHRWNLQSFAKTLERSFYSPEVERAVRKLIRDTRPDVAYVLHFLKKLSPSLLVGIKEEGVPIVARLSDVLLICPEAHFMRDGEICTACAQGSIWPSVKYRCVKDSLSASFVHYLSWHYHSRRKFFDLIDRFIVPSEHLMKWMIYAGWPPDKFRLIPTFVSDRFFNPTENTKQQSSPYILYVGHLEAHKGVDTLIKGYAQAARDAKADFPRLKIAGGLASSFARLCKELVEELSIASRVDFLDFVDDESLPDLYRYALLTVLPSRCYENLPNVLIESYASGTAVLGSSHGSIAPLIRDGITGATFRPGDVEDLAEKLGRFCNDTAWCERSGRAAREYAEREHRMGKHLDTLLEVFEQTLATANLSEG